MENAEACCSPFLCLPPFPSINHMVLVELIVVFALILFWSNINSSKVIQKEMESYWMVDSKNVVGWSWFK